MADEAIIRKSLQITNGEFKYRSFPTDFKQTVTGKKGPVPGSLLISIFGTDISFTELTTPALCEIKNFDTTNFVEYGIFDGTEFYPLGEVLPETFEILRLSRNLGRSTLTGTATVDTDTYTLRLKADSEDCECYVGAFET